MAHQPATPPTNSNRACHDYNRLIILLVLADNHTLANLHHPRWDLNTSQGPNPEPNNREEDQESDQDTGNDRRSEDLDSFKERSTGWDGRVGSTGRG
jgi:hypothetical protein